MLKFHGAILVIFGSIAVQLVSLDIMNGAQIATFLITPSMDTKKSYLCINMFSHFSICPEE